MSTIRTYVAVADEFTVFHDEDGFIRILDGEQSVRLTLPFDVYMKLCEMSVNHFRHFPHKR